MIRDEYGTMGYSEREIVEKLKENINFDYSNSYIINATKYIDACYETFLDVPKVKEWNNRSYDILPKEYHEQLQNIWLMSEEYQNLDVEKILLEKCKSEEEINRVKEELILYKKFNLINLLRYLIYLKSIATLNNVIWGVGRGSSCSSYCLFLLNIHRVNSIVYNLNINEFLREN